LENIFCAMQLCKSCAAPKSAFSSAYDGDQSVREVVASICNLYRMEDKDWVSKWALDAESLTNLMPAHQMNPDQMVRSRESPGVAVGVIAAIAFIWGATR
jgi:hypothetical protein